MLVYTFAAQTKQNNKNSSYKLYSIKSSTQKIIFFSDIFILLCIHWRDYEMRKQWNRFFQTILSVCLMWRFILALQLMRLLPHLAYVVFAYLNSKLTSIHCWRSEISTEHVRTHEPKILYRQKNFNHFRCNIAHTLFAISLCRQHVYKTSA